MRLGNWESITVYVWRTGRAPLHVCVSKLDDLSMNILDIFFLWWEQLRFILTVISSRILSESIVMDTKIFRSRMCIITPVECEMCYVFPGLLHSLPSFGYLLSYD